MKRNLKTLVSVVAVIAALISCGPKQVVQAETKVEKVEAVQQGLTDKQKDEIKKFSSFASNNKRQNKYRETISYIDKVLAIDPTFSEAKNILLYWKGSAYEELKNQDSAKIMFEQFSKINPRHTGVLQKLEYMYYSDNKLDMAIEANKQLIDLDSSKVNPEPYKKVGTYLMALAGNAKDDENKVAEYEKQAMDYFEEYVDLAPEPDTGIENILNVLISKPGYRSMEDQIARHTKVLESNPKDLKALDKLSFLYRKNNDNKKAEEFALKYLEVDPENPKIIKRMTQIYANNPAKGIIYNQKAMKLEPKNEAYNVNLAKFYKEQKNYAAARSNCAEALNKNPRNKNVYRIWADLYSEAVGACAKDIEFQDKLVYVIAYGIYEKAGLVKIFNTMRENGQVPSKSDIFQSKGTKRPSRGCYSWINGDWDEVKYIDAFLSQNR